VGGISRQAGCAGLFQGANITWQAIFMNNLLPVTIGNTIAGAILMAGACRVSGSGRERERARVRLWRRERVAVRELM